MTIQLAQTSATVDVKTNSVTVTVDTSTYSSGSIMGAAYVFIDRCFVWLDANGESGFTVVLSGRAPMNDDSLGALSGEFANELLAQALREKIAEKNKALLETVVGRAVHGAMGPVSAEPDFDLSELEALELDDEPFEDPLGIAMSWEDKYGKKRASRKEAEEIKAKAAAEASEA
ncbi:MAG: His-Xaa-Ser system protein HxsD [Bradymonadia bacterium]|jgi:His-Xaa-Ser system protein HxsD